MQEFFLKASYYCSLSEHCIQKVREKLVQWETPKEFIQPIIDRLVEEDYINEERFARAFVKDKFRFNHWGRIKITTHLRALAISSDIIAKDSLNIVNTLISDSLPLGNRRTDNLCCASEQPAGGTNPRS